MARAKLGDTRQTLVTCARLGFAARRAENDEQRREPALALPRIRPDPARGGCMRERWLDGARHARLTYAARVPDMLRRLRHLARAGYGLALTAWNAACDDGADTPAERRCIPGETRTCYGPGACAGGQSCRVDGSGFDACDCGPAAADAAAPMQQIAPVSPPVSSRNRVAARCQVDSDCGPDLVCWAAGSRGMFGMPGGPAGGYCTLGCFAQGQCEGIDPAASCLENELGDSFCARRCLTKAPYVGEGKCLDRPEVVCWSPVIYNNAVFDPLTRQEGACTPFCGSDAECEGSFCDPVTGQCVDTPPAGAAIGSNCTVDTDCVGGLCLATGDATVFACSAACTYGYLGCGYPAQTSSREALCVEPWVNLETGSEDVGDLGICAELCDVTADCSHPSFVCELNDLVPDRAGFCNLPRVSGADAGAPPG